MEHRVHGCPSGDIHYWIGGAGSGDRAPVVFTHGATADHGLFDAQVAHFRTTRRVVVWDVPKHGLSRPFDGFSLDGAARELLQILETVGIERAHHVGQSMGGYVCQFLARDHPERVASLTVAGSSPLNPTYYSALDRWLLSITPALLKLYPHRRLVRRIAEQVAVTPEARAYVWETTGRSTRAEIADIMRAVYAAVLDYRRTEPLDVPLLITHGSEERTGRVATYSARWAAEEGRPLAVIPDAAHNCNADNPEAFNRRVEAFFSEHERVNGVDE
ncbi:MAG: alpha/beta hydrolase [Planctomycetota bacterium]